MKNPPSSRVKIAGDIFKNFRFAIPEPPPKSSFKELTINGKIYKILALIGKGGSSKVYLVRNYTTAYHTKNSESRKEL